MSHLSVGSTAERLAERMSKARDDLDAQWDAFEVRAREARPESLSVAEVPFPPEVNPLQAPPLESAEKVVALYKKAVLRWHPDKVP